MRFVLKKAAIFTFTLWVIATTTFFLMKALPGDPFTEEKAIPAEILHSIRAHYGLDKDLSTQYLIYLKSLIHFDFGPSLKYQGRSVNHIIAEGFPVSFTLGIEALILALSIGILLGILAAFYRGRWADSLSMVTAVVGISVPSFILASLFQFLFALKLNLFPIARWESFSHTVLPAISLSLLPMAFIARLTRSSMIEVLQSPYIKCAIAKGLPMRIVIFRHALKNALLPVVSYLGPLLANILTGSFVIEKIFAIPGLGHWFVASIQNRDYSMIMGTTVFYSFILLFSVFAVDLLYIFLDPRIRLEEEHS